MQDLNFGIKVDSSGIGPGINAVKNELNKLSSVSNIGDTINNSFSQLPNISSNVAKSLAVMGTSLAVVGTTVAAISVSTYKFADSLSNMADNIDESSQKLGVSIGFYQKLQSAANKTGTDISIFTSSMRSVINTAFDASNGNEKLADTYKSIGVSVTDTDGKLKSQEKLFGEVLLALSNMEQGTRRSAIANDLLGRSSAELAPLLNEGADAVKKYVTENDGAVLVSQRLADASSKYRDTLQQMKETMLQTLYTAVTPFMENISNIAVNMSKSEGFQTFIAWVNKTGEALSNLSGYIGHLSKGMAIEKLEKNLEKEKSLLKLGNEMTNEIRRYEAIYAKNRDNGTQATIQELKARREALAIQYKSLKDSNKAEYERLYTAKEYSDVVSDISNTNSDIVTKTKEQLEAEEKIKAIRQEAFSTVKDVYDDYIQSSHSTRLIAIADELKAQLNAIEASGLKQFELYGRILTKEEAITLARIANDKKVKEENKRNIDEIAEQEKRNIDEIDKQRKDLLEKNINDIKKVYSEATKTLDILKESASDSIFSAMYDPQFYKVQSETLSKISEYKELLLTTENELKDPANANNTILKIRLGLLESLIFNTESYLGISKDNPFGTMASAAGAMARNIDLLSKSKKPEWMTEQVKFVETFANGDWGNPIGSLVDKSFGEKLKEQWKEIDFGDKVSLITDQTSQITKTIMDGISSVANYKIQQDLRMAQSEHDKSISEINSMKISQRQKKMLIDKADKEFEEKQKEANIKQGKLQIAQIWSSTAMGIAGAWAQAFATNAPAFAPIIAGISTGLLLGNAGIQTGVISKNINSHATGGVIGGFNGASMGNDNSVATVREGEMILNAEQQRGLFKKLNSNTGNDLGGITLNIYGNITQSHLTELENNLMELSSMGRLNRLGM